MKWKLPRCTPRKALAISVGAPLLAIGTILGVEAHDRDDPDFDFAFVTYTKHIPEIYQELQNRGFTGIEHLQAASDPQTCNEHGGRAEAANLVKQGRARYSVFQGNFDYSICGETSHCCTVYLFDGATSNEIDEKLKHIEA